MILEYVIQWKILCTCRMINGKIRFLVLPLRLAQVLLVTMFCGS